MHAVEKLLLIMFYHSNETVIILLSMYKLKPVQFKTYLCAQIIIYYYMDTYVNIYIHRSLIPNRHYQGIQP